MSEEREWTPETGKLVVRTWTQGLVRMTYEFRDKPGDPMHRVHVAQVNDWKGEPNVSSCVETMKTQTGFAGGGAFIEFRYATRSDIELLFKVWDHGHHSVEEWIERLRGRADYHGEIAGLLLSEIERIEEAWAKVSGTAAKDSLARMAEMAGVATRAGVRSEDMHAVIDEALVKGIMES